MGKFGPFISYISIAELTISGMLLFILFLVKQNHKANIFLALFILSISMPLPASLVSRESRFAGEIFFFFSVSATAVSGSLIYMYIRFITGEIETLKGKDLLHLIPFPLFLAVLFLYRFAGPGTGEKGFSPFVSSFALLSLVIPTVYTTVSFLKIRHYAKRVENWFSDTERMSISWLRRITVPGLLLFVMWDMGFAATALHLVPRNSFIPLPHLFLIALICLITTYHVVRQPDIFSASRDMKALDSSGDEPDGSREKYAKQSIDLDMQQNYLDSLLTHMLEKKPYLNEDITIRGLSQEVGIPIHHLSIVINNMLHKNFSAFINEYRIKEALTMLDAPDAEEVNILSVAFTSGFSSKSSFNSAFKKITGKTPSEYRERQHENTFY